MPTLAPSVVDSLQTDSPSKPLKKVGFVSLGCPKNLVDSEVMMGILNSAGAEITVRAEEADVIVVNTCSFIDSAKQESVNTILEMARHKIDGRAQKLVVAGCLVERYRDEIRKNIPEVDAVVGTVTQSIGALGKGIYQVDDGTGRLWVVASTRGVPSKGAKVGVKGHIMPTVTFLGINYATVLEENERRRG